MINDYEVLQNVYNYLNKELWENALGPCIITFTKRPGVHGVFSPNSFQSRDGEKNADELAMNPITFAGRTDEEIFSTLCHEMAHKWQKQHGTPGRNGYHNKEWVQEMLRVGLQPLSATTGQKGTGQKVTHKIIENGPFQKAIKQMNAIELGWQGRKYEKKEKDKPTVKSKIAYVCKKCKSKVWGKPGLQIICGACKNDMKGDQ